MATKVSIPALIQALGGKENLAQATHCATRLRVTTRDKSKIDEAALKAIPGVLGVVNNGTQTQIIIGAEVNNVYKDFIAQTGVDEEAPIDENLDLKDELKNKKGKLLTRFFETVAAIFNPIVPALAGCGFLSALICIFMALGFDSSAPTFKTIIAISMAIFTFLPFLLAASAAKVFKMNMFVAMTICAGMMSSTWSGLIGRRRVQLQLPRHSLPRDQLFLLCAAGGICRSGGILYRALPGQDHPRCAEDHSGARTDYPDRHPRHPDHRRPADLLAG